MSTSLHRVLVVGSGSIGERHVRCLQRTGRAAVGICELSASLREKVADRYGIDHAYADLDAAFAEDWDAAVIATPAHTHITLAAQCARAGLALLIEKPLAVDLDQAPALVELVERQGVPAAMAYVYRAHPALQAMHDAIASGRFGRPLELVVMCGQNFPTYRPAYRETYYTRHETGGGAIQDALTHVLNSCEWLVGPITRLTADAEHLALPGVEVEDTVHMIARHGDVLASYALNQHQAPNENTMTVVCECGTARFDLQNHTWQWMTQPDTPWEHQRIAFQDRDDWFTAQEDAFLDVLAGVAAPLCTLAEGLQTLQSTRAVLASAQAGGVPQTLDAEAGVPG